MNGLRQGLMELGAHIGTHKSMINSGMASYVVGTRKGQAIIDLTATISQIRKAQGFMRDVGKRAGHVMFYHATLHRNSSMIQAAFMSMFGNRNLSLLTGKWKGGVLSNYHMQFTKVFEQLVQGDVYKVKTMNMTWLIIRVLSKTNNPSDMDSKEFKAHMFSMRKFWRLLTLFKMYKICNRLPDVIVLVNPDRTLVPLHEANHLAIPIVGIVDTDHYYHNISYPIVCNDDSIMLSLFMFEMLTKAYEEGHSEMLVV
ncbi:ribosomal protein S2 [Acrasis kona]|uniref:Ribosomal protein S2 n=1 Tax=Acrasis kona TaxID=1008807 RepID=A0AAW2YT85_9EUKA